MNLQGSDKLLLIASCRIQMCTHLNQHPRLPIRATMIKLYARNEKNFYMQLINAPFSVISI